MWKFKPIFKSKVWGGNRIPQLFGRAAGDKIGECWILSGVQGSLSEMDGGSDDGMTITELIRRDGRNVLGKLNYQRYGETFPLLVKVIDAAEKLSVQVHPDDGYALELGRDRGKTEMWYVVDAEVGAKVAVGFDRPLSPEQFSEILGRGDVEGVLAFHDVAQGDVFFIPGGTIHSVGAGCLLIEVQQASDDTFRVYDYCRKDTNGNPRELHIERALRALKFDDAAGGAVSYARVPDIPINLVRSPYFSSNVMTIDEPMLRDYSECDSFVVIIGAKGSAMLMSASGAMQIKEGEAVLVPASTDNVNILPDGIFTALEVYIKQ